MALIKCPECGENISSTTEHCIHCGCKFTACPDCGYVSVDKFSICPDCGCVIRYDQSDVLNGSVADNENESIGKALYNKFVTNSAIDGVLVKRKKVICLAIHAVGALFGIIALIVFLTWDSCGQLEQLAKFKDIYTNIRWMLIVCVVIVVFPSENMIKHLLRLRILSMLKNEKVDVESCIRELYNSVVSADEKGYALFAEQLQYALYMSTKPKEKVCIALNILLQAAAYVVFVVGLTLFIEDNLRGYLTAMLTHKKHDWEYYWLIVSGVTLAVGGLIYVFDITGFETRCGKWEKKSLLNNISE